MSFHIIIPARYQSQRLPGKVMADIAGKPLLERVYERALLCGADSVTVATDDQRVFTWAKAKNIPVCMTRVAHNCGTERLSEAVEHLGLPDDAIVVNVQGDEPFVRPADILQVVADLEQHSDAAAATLYVPLASIADLFNVNAPKIILDKKGYALYFTRSPAPWDRDRFYWGMQENISLDAQVYFRHVGVYAYRAETLKKFINWQSAPIEEIEKLEQLRILWNGEKICASLIGEMPLPGVDTPEDLFRLQALAEADDLLFEI